MTKYRAQAALFAFAAATVAASPSLAKNDKVEAVVASPSETPIAAFTESALAQLGGAKRVVISDVVVHLQYSTGFTRANSPFLGKSRVNGNNADAVLQLDGVSQSTMTSIADLLYKQLGEDLKAAGYEVVPEAQLKASAAYQELIQKSGRPQFFQHGNMVGDEVAFGPSSLGFYWPFYYEVGTFVTEQNALVGPVVSDGRDEKGMNASMGEQKIAKELNAVVVKASYMLSFGAVTGIELKASSTKGGTTTDGLSGRTSTEFTVANTASGLKTRLELGLLPDQTRISFRTATGKRFQARSMLKLEPPKDGDVVVRLANEVIQPGAYFQLGEGRLVRNPAKVDAAQRNNSKFIVGGLMNRFKLETGGGDITSTAHVKVGVINEQNYIDAVGALARKSNAAMLALMKQ